MQTWFDLMRQAQGNAGFGTVMEQFGLSSTQAQRAMAAFMPAFALGLQQAATRTNDPARLFSGIAESPFVNFWQTTTRAFTPQANEAGKQILDQLFGSDEVSRQVARQAAAVTGIGLETMQQTLPLFAGIFAGSVHQWMTHPEHMTGTLDRKPPKPAPNAAEEWMTLWTDFLKGETATKKRKTSDNPFEALMAPFLVSPTQEKSSQPIALWGEMLGAGRDLQEQYFASLQSILESAQPKNRKEP
ncbi:DUF937 domain-containing protein [Microvirga sp. 2MCAF38]|uniref:DUF937 domain-containing protein n=1 Tax=Microvirga sp. 2MCAF38 TaxID=3232989 RepID=UPI003F96AE7B